MGLAELKSDGVNVHLLYTDSDMVNMYVYDTLKSSCNATLESILEVNTIRSFNNMLETVNMLPFLADRWLCVINYHKVKSVVGKYKQLFSADTACFLVTVSNYKEFKEFKDLVRCNEMYMSFIKSKDVNFLFRESGMAQSLIDFTAKSYGRDPDKVMTLYRAVGNGLPINERKDIVNICGASSSTIINFLLSLISANVNTERGYKQSLKKKIKEALDLGQMYGISSFRNFSLSTVKDVLVIKEMYLNADIYDSIRDVPECYDEKKLMKYRFYLDTIKGLNIHDLIELFSMIRDSGVWRENVDIISFLYEYYERRYSVK